MTAQKSKRSWSTQEEQIISTHAPMGREAIRRALAKQGYKRTLNAIKGHQMAMRKGPAQD